MNVSTPMIETEVIIRLIVKMFGPPQLSARCLHLIRSSMFRKMILEIMLELSYIIISIYIKIVFISN